MSKELQIIGELRITNNLMSALINRHVHNDSNLNRVTMLHGRIIRYLSENKEIDVFQRDIEVLLAVRRSTATTILQCMEKNGLITRRSMSSDARLKKLCLTEKSESINDFIYHKFSAMEQLARKDISDEELECFFMVLEQIRENFREN